MNVVVRLKERLGASIAIKEKLLHKEKFLSEFEHAVDTIVKAYQRGGRLYIAGNGGSAADAQHLAAEFVSKLAQPRDPLPAEALTVDSSILTAIGNDYGFEEIFARQLEAKLKPVDVFLGITTSGQSKNILRALEQCKKMKVPTVVFSGRDGGQAKTLADHCLIVEAEDTSLIQEVHIILYHTVCACVEEAMFPSNQEHQWVTKY